MTGRSAWFLWIGLLLGVAPGALAQSVGQDSDSALRYRRVLVPQDRLSELTRGYLPLERSVFRQLVERTQSSGKNLHVGTAWIESAEYRASFTPGQQLSGQCGAACVPHVARTNTAIAGSLQTGTRGCHMAKRRGQSAGPSRYG